AGGEGGGRRGRRTTLPRWPRRTATGGRGRSATGSRPGTAPPGSRRGGRSWGRAHGRRRAPRQGVRGGAGRASRALGEHGQEAVLGDLVELDRPPVLVHHLLALRPGGHLEAVAGR